MPVYIGGIETHIGASIGTAVATTPTCTPDQLITNADLALYEVTRSGRRHARAFDQSMRDRYDATQQLIVDLQDAVAQQTFEPHFQPQISVKTGQLTGFEILARWPHPALGLLGPDDFMDLALESHLLDKIDAIVCLKGLCSNRVPTARLRPNFRSTPLPRSCTTLNS